MSIRINSEGGFKSSNSIVGNGSSGTSWSSNYGANDFFGELSSAVKSQDLSGSNSFFGGLGALFNKAVSFWDDYTGNTANRENIAFQKEYNEQVFKRADTQYQRTVADLRAAGLSSQLAAGAPSTVAGQSSAPQRAVGNESQAMERLIGMITSMKSADANSNLANAQADKARAEAEAYPALVASQIGSNEASAIANRAKARYDVAMAHIAEIQSPYVADKIDAEIKHLVSQTEYQNSLKDLALKQMDLVEAQTGHYNADKARIRQLTENLKQEKKNLIVDWDNKVKQGLKLDAETENIVQSTFNLVIDSYIKDYNFWASREHGLRTTDAYPGGPFDVGEFVWPALTAFDNVTKPIRDWNRKWTPLYWLTSGNYPWKTE